MIRVGSKAKSASISATVTRANGRVERLGMVAFHHRNPVINWVGNAYIKIKEMLRK